LTIFRPYPRDEKAVVEDGVDLMGYTPWGCIDLVSADGEMKNATALSMSIKIMTGVGHCTLAEEIFFMVSKSHPE
jgi:hypothetical protein